jgi:hypothetical protein
LIKASAQEIRSLALELLDRLDSKALYSQEDEDRQMRFKALFREGHYAYRTGSRIGRDFLSTHFAPAGSVRPTLAPAASATDRPEIA